MSHGKGRYGPGQPRGLDAVARMALVVLLLLSASSCSIKRMAVGMIGNALAEGGETYGSDDDPDLVGQAVPFGLKLMESLLAQVPEHRGLLTAAAKGFTQYAYAYVQFEADQVESRDLARATELRRRARNLYLRARDYGLRGLETRHRGFGEALRAAPAEAVQTATRDDLALLYWTGAAWGAAIGVSKEPDLVADQLIVEALFDRVLALEETFDHGAVHGVLIGYEFARQGAAGDPEDRSRRHFERAVELTGGQSSGPYVSFAETAAVRRQDRAEFERLLHLALAVDPDARPAWRLANLIMQRRARWLLARGDELFADPPELEGSGSAFRLDPR